jgi:cytochrome P450
MILQLTLADVFHKQRKFGVLLGNFTVHNEYHGRMVPEVQRLLVNLLNRSGPYDKLAEQCCARITCELAFGNPEPHAEIVHNAHRLMRNLSPGGRITNILTPLQLLPDWLSGEKVEENKRNDYEMNLWSGIFNQLQDQHNQNILKPCYASYYFNNKARVGLTDLEATYGIGMMATVAILTITAPLSRFILAITLYPEWQEAVQDELDRVLKGRMFELKDLPLVPTLRAVVLESMRWTSPLPTGKSSLSLLPAITSILTAKGIPHRVQEDIHWNGHIIRKGTNIMACDW